MSYSNVNAVFIIGTEDAPMVKILELETEICVCVRERWVNKINEK